MTERHYDYAGRLVAEIGTTADEDREFAHEHEVAPGETCTTCKRKVPHPRKPSSPTTKPVSYRVPLDEIEAHQETLDAAAHFVGVAEQPFSHFKVYTLALALLLQDEGLRGYGYRA
jgi:hypothetical protein